MIQLRNLYSMVIREIERRAGRGMAGTVAQRYSYDSASIMTQHDVQDIINTLSTDLGEIIEARIIQDLDISATSPPSNRVTVTAGIGTASGRKYELEDDTTIDIPFDGSTYVFYVNLFGNTLEVSKFLPSNRCPIGKIIIPKPGTTSRIVDDKPVDGYDAWIVPSKDVFFSDDKKFDDATKELIKDAMPEIAAEIIFGTLTASETLTITNTQGTMSLGSKSMVFKNYGGEELAYYGADKARVGNIEVWPKEIRSKNFMTGVAGFQIKDNGDVEFNDIVARGTIYATAGEIGGWHIDSTTLASADNADDATILLDSANKQIRVGDTGNAYITIDGDSNRMETSDFVSGSLGRGWRINGDGSVEFQNAFIRGSFQTVAFKKETMSATGGLFIVSPASVLDDDMTASGTTLVTKDNSFVANDVIRLKDGTEDEWMLITDASDAPTYAVTRDLADDYDTNDCPEWQKGTAVVSMARSGTGFIYIDSVSTHAPFMDVYERESSTYNDYNLKVRLGMLNGLIGRSGAGLYGENVYLTGHVDATSGSLQNLDVSGEILIDGPGRIITSSTTPRLIMDSTGIALQSTETTYKYGNFLYSGASGTIKYGAGNIAKIFDAEKEVPFYMTSAHSKSDIHLYNRGDNPTGEVELGDIICKNATIYNCVSAQSTGSGAFVPVGSQPETLSDANAKNNQMYYSSTQGALAYKNSGGTVYTFDLTPA